MRQPNWQSVTGVWEEPTVIVGCGPSLKGFDFSRLKNSGHRVIAVKKSIHDVPFADVCIYMDSSRLHKENLWLRQQKINTVAAMHYQANPTYPICDEFTYIRREDHCSGLSQDPSIIHCGGSSGSVGVGYAYHKKTPRVLLLGFDYYMEDEENRKGHHYDDAAYYDFSMYNIRQWQAWAEWYKTVSGFSVYNANPKSLIKCFPFMSYDEWEASLTRRAA